MLELVLVEEDPLLRNRKGSGCDEWGLGFGFRVSDIWGFGFSV